MLAMGVKMQKIEPDLIYIFIYLWTKVSEALVKGLTQSEIYFFFLRATISD